MLLFRSEDHLEEWLASGERPHGEVLTLDQQWDLATRWFAGRHESGWRKRTAAEAEALFRSVGLAGDFWRLTNP